MKLINLKKLSVIHFGILSILIFQLFTHSSNAFGNEEIAFYNFVQNTKKLESILKFGLLNYRLGNEGKGKTKGLYEAIIFGADREVLRNRDSNIAKAILQKEGEENITDEQLSLASLVKPDDFPKYGILGLKNSNNCNPGIIIRASTLLISHYGKIIIEFNVNPDKLFYSEGDSIDRKKLPTKLLSDSTQRNLISDQVKDQVKDKIKKVTLEDENEGLYIEAQINGRISSKDINKIFYFSNLEIDEKVKIQELASLYGVYAEEISPNRQAHINCFTKSSQLLRRENITPLKSKLNEMDFAKDLYQTTSHPYEKNLALYIAAINTNTPPRWILQDDLSVFKLFNDYKDTKISDFKKEDIEKLKAIYNRDKSPTIIQLSNHIKSIKSLDDFSKELKRICELTEEKPLPKELLREALKLKIIKRNFKPFEINGMLSDLKSKCIFDDSPLKEISECLSKLQLNYSKPIQEESLSQDIFKISSLIGLPISEGDIKIQVTKKVKELNDQKEKKEKEEKIRNEMQILMKKKDLDEIKEKIKELQKRWNTSEEKLCIDTFKCESVDILDEEVKNLKECLQKLSDSGARENTMGILPDNLNDNEKILRSFNYYDSDEKKFLSDLHRMNITLKDEQLSEVFKNGKNQLLNEIKKANKCSSLLKKIDDLYQNLKNKSFL